MRRSALAACHVSRVSVVPVCCKFERKSRNLKTRAGGWLGLRGTTGFFVARAVALPSSLADLGMMFGLVDFEADWNRGRQNMTRKYSLVMETGPSG